MVILFQKITEDDCHHFNPLVNYARENLPTFELPWLQDDGTMHSKTSKKELHDVNNDTNNTSRPTHSFTRDNATVQDCKDYTHLYIYKSDIDKDSNSRELSGLNPMGVEDTSVAQLGDCLKEKKRKLQQYLPADLGRMCSNTKKQKKKKKIREKATDWFILMWAMCSRK